MQSDTVDAFELTYEPPFDWNGMLAFLGARSLKGVEHASDTVYRRTIGIAGQTGWIAVRNDNAASRLKVEYSAALASAVPIVRDRLGRLFDLDARPAEIARTLKRDPLLEEAVNRNPGLRVPGAFDGFELAVRAVLGQQITVKAAATLAGRFSIAFGEAVVTPHAGLTHLSPAAERVARASIDEIASLGIIRARTVSILRLAEAVAAGRLKLDAGGDPDATMKQLTALPGIGPWTAHYIAMRALRVPDAFPKEDIALRNRLGGMTAKEADARSQVWRPWRSYATLHLWSLPQIER
jgi:AraC family transcriptional regulator, regulatory protein of adaptative response / DNA-3-methyladenine glycosylase II